MYIVDEDQVQKIYNKIKDLIVNTFEGKVIIDPATDIGDKIVINGKNVIYQGEMSLEGRFIAQISSKIQIKQKEETTVKKESQKVVNRRVQSRIDQADGKIEQLVEEVGDRSEKKTSITQDVDGITQSVSNVEEKVETVESTAKIAKTTAENANATANTASSTANTAKSTAEKANTIAETANTTAKDAKQKADDTDNNLSTNYYTKTETNSQITQKAESITSEVSKTYSTKTETSNAKQEAIKSANSNTDDKLKGYTETSKLGTAIEQNYEHVKVAWNQISDFIQMMIINNNASLAILDKDKNIMMALDKIGQHFYKEDGTEFGEMGVNAIDNQNYISFGVAGEYDKEISDGMAWGITTKSDGKFWPILYIKNFSMGPKNSDASSGELVLSACNLILDGIGTGIKTGDIFISGDVAMGNVTFEDTGTGTILMNIRPQNVVDYPAIDILGNISFYANQAGSNSFKIGECLFTDSGDITGKHVYIEGDITSTEHLTAYKGINCTDGYVSGKAFINNSREETKKNIKRYTDNAIKIIKDTDIYKFNYKTDNSTSKESIGFVIGDKYKYSKELTAVDENGKEIGANTYNMISIAYKAIQEQQEQIEELHAKDKQKDELIQSLIQRIETLEKEVNK